MGEEYFQPDDRWTMYGITSEELHEKHAVIKGYFHKGVPEDVVKEFATVEYLMAHAYYYWPMYDEALRKCLLTFEMAIKQCSVSLGVSLKEVKKNGKPKDLSLYQLIEQLCTTHWFKPMQETFHKIRKNRNNFAHSNRHGFMGPNGSDQFIKHIVNTLNHLFLSKQELEFYNQQTELISKELYCLNKYVLKLEGQGHPFLLSCIYNFQPVCKDLIMTVFPMRSEYNSSPKGFDDEHPNTYVFKEYSFKDQVFEGTTKEGVELVISVTDNPQNIKAKKERDAYIVQLDESQKRIFHSSMNYQANWELVKAEYAYNKEVYF
ncbi:MAG: hypothetical protein ACMZ7B_00855 [Balneola sp.]